MSVWIRRKSVEQAVAALWDRACAEVSRHNAAVISSAPVHSVRSQVLEQFTPAARRLAR